MEIMRADEPSFTEFGQTYLTTAFPNVIKAWHWHENQDDNFCVVKGMARVALYDGRKDSPTFGNVCTYFIGEKNPQVIHIPRGVWHGYKAIGNETCYLINLVTKAYDYNKPDENRAHYIDSDPKYDWSGDING